MEGRVLLGAGNPFREQTKNHTSTLPSICAPSRLLPIPSSCPSFFSLLIFYSSFSFGFSLKNFRMLAYYGCLNCCLSRFSARGSNLIQETELFCVIRGYQSTIVMPLKTSKKANKQTREKSDQNNHATGLDSVKRKLI